MDPNVAQQTGTLIEDTIKSKVSFHEEGSSSFQMRHGLKL